MVIIGCPFGSLSDVFKELKNLRIEFIDAADVKCIGFEDITLRNDRRIYISEIKASFLRYPYDLIPPFTKTFGNREWIETYKTLALVFDHVGLNKLSRTWELRNRLYSLLEFQKAGGNVPKTTVGEGLEQLKSESTPSVIKAIGNCYVDEHIPKSLSQFYEIASEGEETAVIFPANLIYYWNDESSKAFREKRLCVQEWIQGEELRGHIFGSDFRLLKRKRVASFDQSSGSFQEFKGDYFHHQLFEPFRRLMLKHDIKYLCFDVIVNDNGPTVIDINPYGSLPSYSKFPDHSRLLAKLIRSAIV